MDLGFCKTRSAEGQGPDLYQHRAERIPPRNSVEQCSPMKVTPHRSVLAAAGRSGGVSRNDGIAFHRLHSYGNTRYVVSPAAALRPSAERFRLAARRFHGAPLPLRARALRFRFSPDSLLHFKFSFLFRGVERGYFSFQAGRIEGKSFCPS